MLELTVQRTAADIMQECKRRGLVVKMETFERKHNARHWHLGFTDQPGVLEVTELGGETVLKVADNRDCGWAKDFAQQLARRGS